MSTESRPARVKLLKKLFARDTGENRTIYLQKGHAAAAEKMSVEDTRVERTGLGWYSHNMTKAKPLIEQHLEKYKRSRKLPDQD